MRVHRSLRTFVSGLSVLGLTATMLVGVPFVAHAELQDGEFVDQAPGGEAPLECNTSAYPGGVSVNPGSGVDLLDFDMGTHQTFVPSIGRIDRIELCLTPVLAPGDVVNALLNGGLLDADFNVVIHQVTNEGGPIDTRTGTLSLAKATTAGVLSQETDWYSVSLDPHDSDGDGIDDRTVFTPGATYAIELADPSIQFIWRATCGGSHGASAPCHESTPDAYPRGEPASPLSGSVEVGDFGFRTISTQGADLVGRFVDPLSEIVCPDLSTFDSVTVEISNVGTAAAAASTARLTAQGPDNLAPVDLGVATVGALVGQQAVTLDITAFDRATDVEQLSGIGTLVFELTVDADDVVNEIVEENNTSTAEILMMSCHQGALIEPLFSLAEGEDGALPHGMTRLPYTRLTAAEWAAGGHDFGNQDATSVAPKYQIIADGEDPAVAPLTRGPLFRGVGYVDPAAADGVLDSSLAEAPLTRGPLTRGPLTRGPLTRGPLTRGPLTRGGVTEAPLTRGPLTRGPLTRGGDFAQPFVAYQQDAAYQASHFGNLAVVFQGLSDDFLATLPVDSIHTSPDIMEFYREAGVEMNGRLRQDLSLLDLRQDGILPRIPYSDTDVTLMYLPTAGNTLLANVRLGELPPIDGYRATNGTNDLCAMLTDATTVACDDLVARFGSLDDVTILALALEFNVNIAALPLGRLPMADFTVGRDAASGNTGSAIFDLPLANTSYQTAVDENGAPLELPAQMHAHLFSSLAGSLVVGEDLADASLVDCDDMGLSAEDCASLTLAEVEQAYGFRAEASMADLYEALDEDASAAVTLAAITPAFLSPGSQAWQFWDNDPIDVPALQRRVGLEVCEPALITAAATVDKSRPGQVANPVAEVVLARGFDLHSVVGAKIDGQEIPLDDVVIDESDPLDAVQTIRAKVRGIAADNYEVTLAICASDTLGDFDQHHPKVDYQTFVLDPMPEPGSVPPDFDLTTLSSTNDTHVTLTVTEDGEDVEATDGVEQLYRINTITHRMPNGSDTFSIDPLNLLDDNGEPLALREGDILNFYLRPTPGHLEEALDASGNVVTVPVGGIDLDMAAYALAPSQIYVDTFGQTEDFLDPVNREPVKWALTDNSVVPVADGSVHPTALDHSPLTRGPLTRGPLTRGPLTRGELENALTWSNNRADRGEMMSIMMDASLLTAPIDVEVFSHNLEEGVESYEFWFTVQRDGGVEFCDPIHQTSDPLAAGYLAPAPIGESIPALTEGVETLILFDPQVATSIYGDLGNFEAELAAFAAHPEVNGVVVNPSLSDAYEAVNRNYLTTSAWCRPEEANRVAGQLRRIIQEARQQTGPAGDPTLKYVMAFGDDSLMPYWRLQDDRPLGNASEMAWDWAVRTQQVNPTLMAALESKFLSDDPSVSSTLRLNGANPAFLPDLPMSRVIGTIAQMSQQIDAWAASGNVAGEFTLGDGESLVTGEVPFEDAAVAVREDLESLGFEVDDSNLAVTDGPGLPGFDDLTASLAGGPQASFIFNHASPWELGTPANTFNGEQQLLDTRDIRASAAPEAADLTFGHIIAAMSCNISSQAPFAHHAAYRDEVVLANPDLNLATNESVQPAWSDVFAELEQTIFSLGSTSFGYGVSPGIDLTEEMALHFEQFLARGMTAGEAALEAKWRQYYGASDYDEYLYKAINTFQMNGFPMARQSDAAPSTPEPIITPPVSETGDGTLATAALTLPDLDVRGTEACEECLQRVVTDEGHYFTANTASLFGGAQAAGGSLLMPTSTTGFAFPDDHVVSDVVITGVDARFAEGVIGQSGSIDEFDFVFGTTRLSGAEELPTNAAADVHTSLKPNVTSVGGKYWVTMPRGGGVMRDDKLGSQLLLPGVNGEFLFSPDGTVPTDAARTVKQAIYRSEDRTTVKHEITVVGSRPLYRAVLSLLTVTGSTAGYQFIDANVDSVGIATALDGSRYYTATFSGLYLVDELAEIRQYDSQAVDTHGVVSRARSETRPFVLPLDGELPPTPDPQPVLDLVGDRIFDHVDQPDVYDGPVEVVLGPNGFRYQVSIDGSPFEQVRGGASFSVTEGGLHTVRARRQFGTEVTEVDFIVDNGAPVIIPITPYLPDAGEQPQVFTTYGASVPIEFDCTDDLPGVVCHVEGGHTTLDLSTVTGTEPRHVTIVAEDVNGRISRVDVPYLVRSGLQVTDFDRPVDGVSVRDELGRIVVPQTYRLTGSKTSTIPFKFAATTPTGEPIGLLSLDSFTWELIAADGTVQHQCVAHSKPGYSYKGSQHHFNAQTACLGDDGSTVERPFRVGETWRFRVSLPDRYELYADVTVT